MERICKHWKIHWRVSPLCNNRWLYNKLEIISENKWVPFRLMIGISYAESHIWINFNPQKCNIANNRAGIKWEKFDNWKTVMFNQDTSKKVEWCWLYKFNDTEHMRNSFANSLSMSYFNSWCTEPKCISKFWVWARWPIKWEWVWRVNLFRP